MSANILKKTARRLVPVAFFFLVGCLSISSVAETGQATFKPRVETNWRHGTARSILMTEAWVPLAQDSGRLIYGDFRLMGDDGDNREWNAGIGYRALSPASDSVFGLHGWMDRRRTSRGSVFYQGAAGVEYLTDDLDIRLNAYVPANQKERYALGASTEPYLADTGIYYDTAGLLVEKPLHGFDVELALPVKPLQGAMDSFRVAAGGFVFSGDDAETLRGIRLRAVADVTSDLQLGARFEADNLRGTQGFVEATLRFPFGSKASAKTLGIRSRMDESPERDIDVITAARVAKAPVVGNPVLNAYDNMSQRIFHVDNTSAAGGDGSVEMPFNTLAAASGAASREGDIIYVHRGDGTSGGMQSGIVLSQNYQSLIGSGTNFIYDSGRFTTADGANFSGRVIIPATSAPVLTNLTGHGVTVAGLDASIAGITVNGASGHGIYAYASGGADLGALSIRNVTLTNNAQDGLYAAAGGAGGHIDVTLENVVADNNRNGLRFYAQQNASLSGSVAASRTADNTQHGIILYDDSAAGSVNVDLGGGGRSDGRNSLYGNGLEDIAVDIDGGTLMARGNWWGQTGGLYQQAPAAGFKPQIYYGAPINDGLILHWTFDSEWTAGTTAYDRSGNGYNGTLTGGVTAGALTAGLHGEALSLSGGPQYVRATGIAGVFSQYTVLASVAPDITSGPAGDYATYGYTVVSDGAAQGASAYPLWMTVRSGEVVARTFNQSNVGVVTSGAGIGNGEWSQIALSAQRSGQSNIYVDGSLRITYNNPGSPSFSGTWNNGNFYVGEIRAGRGIYYDGLVDDVRVYSRILSAAEAAEVARMNTTSIVNTGGYLTSAP